MTFAIPQDGLYERNQLTEQHLTTSSQISIPNIDNTLRKRDRLILLLAPSYFEWNTYIVNRNLFQTKPISMWWLDPGKEVLNVVRIFHFIPSL